MEKTNIVLEDSLFYCEHIEDTDEIKQLLSSFYISKSNARNLEYYLKENALFDESVGNARTYLVRDKKTGELACYFSLKAGMVSTRSTFFCFRREFDSISGIELADFAVNSQYVKNHPNINHIGTITFIHFVYPIVQMVAKYIGAYFLYIFALPEKSLIEHYKELRFRRLSYSQERFIHNHFKPRYNRNCIFMCQDIKGDYYES